MRIVIMKLFYRYWCLDWPRNDTDEDGIHELASHVTVLVRDGAQQVDLRPHLELRKTPLARSIATRKRPDLVFSAFSKGVDAVNVA